MHGCRTLSHCILSASCAILKKSNTSYFLGQTFINASWALQAVILAVPGAFTPTCSLKHLPGFVEKADEIKAKGVDTIACVSVNDAFVMDAWSKSADVGDKILMLADGSAIFTKVPPPFGVLLPMPTLAGTSAHAPHCLQ